jgi:hypothetical protein
VFETGRAGGYTIAPMGEFLGGGLQHPIRGPIKGGPMRPYPALPVGAAWWARIGFNKTASVTCASRGFR